MVYALANTHTLSIMASDFQGEKTDILQKTNQNGLLLPNIKETPNNDVARKKSKCNSGKDLIAIRTPPPPSVARRNARERNRVKQVNNGFANLRQHIPNYIAAAFESNTGKGGNKKLSKVETLRMAVEYIRSLEKLLSLNDNSPTTSVSYPSSTSLEIEHNINYANSLASPSSEDDNISSNSTPPPPSLQYVRIIGSDAYHIVPSHVFDGNERLKLLKVENDLITDSVLIDPDEEFEKVQLSSDINTNTEISPEMYSDSSLSPGVGNGIQGFIPVFNIDEISHQPNVKEKIESIKSNEEMRILCRNLIMLQAEADNTEKQTLHVNELMTW
ncbi:hypothetical protein RN001_003577 [Aquatica leii]|uniref:BHLH domain-containing protein n=1 Tax=Aquatica leii TaxID=1421715 RepID=A0AAN7PNX1_9COLE|nr:hypothetical protein RN001_003577 [Aquatica leii]